MIRTSPGLWQFHTIVADYVLPTKKLCQTLANNTADAALVRDLLIKIQLDPKKRKKIEQAKNYHWFGLACIQSEKPAVQMNPLKANRHHRCVRQADHFNQQIQSIQTSDIGELDLTRARLIAKQLKHTFSDCTIPRLKEEVRAAEELLIKEFRSPQHLLPAYVTTTSDEVAASPAHDSSSLMTVEEVAKKLRCENRKVYELAQNGELPYIDTNASKGKKYKRYRFNPEEVDQYLQRQSNTPIRAQPRRQRKKTTSDDDVVYY